MQGGAWQGRQVVSADYVTRMVTASQPINRSYDLLWWVVARAAAASPVRHTTPMPPSGPWDR